MKNLFLTILPLFIVGNLYGQLFGDKFVIGAPSMPTDLHYFLQDFTATRSLSHNFDNFALTKTNMLANNWSTTSVLGRTFSRTVNGSSYSLLNQLDANVFDVLSLGNGSFNMSIQSASGVRSYLTSTGSSNIAFGIQNTGGANSSWGVFNNSPTDYGIIGTSKDVNLGLIPNNAIMTFRDVVGQDFNEYTRWGITPTAPVDGDYTLSFAGGQATFSPASSNLLAREGTRLFTDGGNEYIELGGTATGQVGVTNRRHIDQNASNAGLQFNTSQTGDQDLLILKSTLNSENDFQSILLENGDNEEFVWRMNGSRTEFGSRTNNAVWFIYNNATHTQLLSDRLYSSHPIQMQGIDPAGINNIGTTRGQYFIASSAAGIYENQAGYANADEEINYSSVLKNRYVYLEETETFFATLKTDKVYIVTDHFGSSTHRLLKVHYTIQNPSSGNTIIRIEINGTAITATSATILAGEYVGSVSPAGGITLNTGDRITLEVTTANGGGGQGLEAVFEEAN